MHRCLKILVILALVGVANNAQYRYPSEDSSQKERILSARLTDARAGENRRLCEKLGLEAIRDNRCYTTYPVETLVWGKGFYEGLGKITVRGKAGFIDTKGNVVIRPTLRDAGYFSEGLAPFEDRKGKWGFLDKSGKIFIKPQFNWALSFREKLAAVQVGSKWGFIDHNGRIRIEPRFESVSSFDEGLAEFELIDKGLATASDTDGKWISGFMDSAGHLKLGGSFHSIHRGFDEGIALVGQPVECPYGSGSETYAIDKRGMRLWTLDSWYVSWFSDNAIIVATGKDRDGHDLYSALGTDGKRLFGNSFSRIEAFSEGLAPARRTWTGKYGYINKRGEFVIGEGFESAAPFSEGLAAVEVGSNNGYIDKSGKIVISPQFELADPFRSGFALVAPTGMGKDTTGYIDRNGHYIWKPTK